MFKDLDDAVVVAVISSTDVAVVVPKDPEVAVTLELPIVEVC